MRLSAKAFAATSGAFWALSSLMVGITNLACSGYRSAFLQVVASIYPGYHAEACVTSWSAPFMLLLTAQIAGLIFACIHHLVAGGKESTT
jgi:hypothetical protein